MRCSTKRRPSRRRNRSRSVTATCTSATSSIEGDRVSGLIDWIDLCRGDPALDLQLVWSVLPPEDRDAFFAAYGDVDDDTLLRARAVALHLSSMLVEYAHHEGLASIEREAMAGLDRAAGL